MVSGNFTGKPGLFGARVAAAIAVDKVAIVATLRPWREETITTHGTALALALRVVNTGEAGFDLAVEGAAIIGQEVAIITGFNARPHSIAAACVADGRASKTHKARFCLTIWSAAVTGKQPTIVATLGTAGQDAVAAGRATLACDRVITAISELFSTDRRATIQARLLPEEALVEVMLILVLRCLDLAMRFVLDWQL